MSLLLEGEFGNGQGHDLAIGLDDAMSLQDLQRHFPNPLLVVQELAFVLSEEDLSQLPERSSPARVHQRSHKKRLIDVAHAHLVFEEVNKVFVFHVGGAMVVPFELFR